MAFEPVYRVAFEEHAGSNLNRQIVGQLRKIDQTAAEIRQHNATPNVKPIDLVATVRALTDELTAASDTARLRTVQAIREHEKQRRDDWQKDRQRHADRSLLEIRDAELRIGSMTDAEAEALVFQYADDRADLNISEILLLRTRLRDSDSETYKAFTELVNNRRADMPWLSTSEDVAASHRADDLEKLPPGAVMIDDDEERLILRIENLVDVDGVLDSVDGN